VIELFKDFAAQVGDAVAIAIAGAIVAALTQLFRKWGLDISEAKRKALQDAATTAVRRTEEEAAIALQRAARQGVSAIGTSGPEKFAQAVAYTRAAEPKAKPDAVVAEVTAALPATGFGAAAKLQAASTTQPTPERP